MGKLVSNFFISLDGVVESPEKWHMPYLDDQMGAAIGKGVEANKAFLMGRRLYEEWSAHWSTKTEDDHPFAAFINNHPKYVVSNSLKSATWQHTTVVSGDVPGRLRALKDEIDGELVVTGSATLVRTLLGHGLVDELRLLVHPIAVGHGARLFDDSSTHPLKLVGHEVFDSGVLNLTYAPADA